MTLRQKYNKAKHDYHTAGKRAAGKKAGSKEARAYEDAKREYHRLGEELRRSNERE